MSTAHINSYLRLKDVLVPTDNNTIALWHFDKHIQSTNGVKPSWNLGRLASGIFGNSILVQEATENLIPTSKQDISTWVFANHTDSGMTITNPFGGVSKLYNVADESFVYLDNQTVLTTNFPYTCSIYVYASHDYTFSLRWSEQSIDSQHIYVKAKTWTKLTNTTTYTSDIRILIGYRDTDYSQNPPAGFQVAYCMPQLEQKSYATPFVSTSIPNEKLSYNISPPSTISCYFKLASYETRATTGDDRLIIWYASVDEQGNYFDNVSSWKVYIPGGGNTLRLECINAQQALASKTIDITNTELNIYDDNWHFMCIRFNNTNMEFMVDNISKNISASPWTTVPIFQSQKLGIGCDPEGFSRSANVYVDELRCDSIFVSTDEIEAWKTSNRPFYDPYDYSIVESSPFNNT